VTPERQRGACVVPSNLVTRGRTRCHEVDSGNDLQVFEGKEFKGGRVKVYGCSPGCLLVSIVLSVFLTLAVNGCLHLVG
jgi:hypothetical protein